MPSFRLLMPFSTLFFLAACEKKPAPLPPLPVAPTPAVRVEAPPQKERLSVNDAMTVNEVAFAMRAGGNDAELVAEIVRRGLVMSYSVGWLAPAEKLLLSIPPETARALPQRLQQLIGYQIHRPNLGWVEGRDPIEWLRGEMGDLAPAGDNLTPPQAAALAQLALK